jgi:hypothetical protein
MEDEFQDDRDKKKKKRQKEKSIGLCFMITFNPQWIHASEGLVIFYLLRSWSILSFFEDISAH